MRILHVVSTMDAAAGGPTRVVAELSKYQALAGDEVTVCTTDCGIDGLKRIDREEVLLLTGRDVSVELFSVDFRPMLVSRSMRSWLRRYCRRFDIVHIHGLYRFPSTYTGYVARHSRKPYVISPHGALDWYLYGKSANGILLKRAYERLFEWRNLRQASAIHFTAEDERFRSAFGALRWFVVPVGVDWERFRTLPVKGKFRRHLGLEDRPLILFLGRINFKKGLDILVQAFDELRKKVPAAILVIVGPDSDGYERFVRELVSKSDLDASVRFVGERHSEEVVETYVDADLFVLSSYSENFGVAVVEAMACGVPVVISDQVNIHREIAGSGSGLVTRCDPKEVEEAMRLLLGDPQKRIEMGLRGREMARTFYSWPKVVASMRDQYLGLIAADERSQK